MLDIFIRGEMIMSSISAAIPNSSLVVPVSRNNSSEPKGDSLLNPLNSKDSFQASLPIDAANIRQIDPLFESLQLATTPINMNTYHVVTATPAGKNILTASMDYQARNIKINVTDIEKDPKTGNYLGNVYLGLMEGMEQINFRSKDCALNFHILKTKGTGEATIGSIKVQLSVDVGGVQQNYAVDIDESVSGNYSLDLTKFRKYSKVEGEWVYGTQTLADIFSADENGTGSRAVVTAINFGITGKKPGVTNADIFLADMSFSEINAQAMITNPQPSEFISSTKGAYKFMATLNRPADVKRAAYVFSQLIDGKPEQKVEVAATIIGPDGKTTFADIDVAKLGFVQGPVNFMVKTWDVNDKEYFSPAGVNFNYSDLAVIQQSRPISLPSCSLYATNNSKVAGSYIKLISSPTNPKDFDLQYARPPLPVGNDYDQLAGFVFPVDYTLRFQSTKDTCLVLEVLSESSLLVDPKIQLGIKTESKTHLFETDVKLLPVYRGAQPGKQFYSMPMLGLKYLGYLDDKYAFFEASAKDKEKTVNDFQIPDDAYISQLTIMPKYTNFKPPRVMDGPEQDPSPVVVASALKISSVKFDPASPGLEITSPINGQASWDEVSFSWNDPSTGNNSYLQFTDKSNGRISHIKATSNPFTYTLGTGQYEVRVFDRKPDASCIATNAAISISVSNSEKPNYQHYTQSVYGTLTNGETVDVPNDKVPVFIFNGNHTAEIVKGTVSKNEQGSRGLEVIFPQDCNQDLYVGGTGMAFSKEQWPIARRKDGYLRLQSVGKMWTPTTDSSAQAKISIQIKDINSSTDAVITDLDKWIDLSNVQTTADGQGQYIDIPLSSFLTKESLSLVDLFKHNPGYAPAGIVVVPQTFYGGKFQLENVSLLPLIDQSDVGSLLPYIDQHVS